MEKDLFKDYGTLKFFSEFILGLGKPMRIDELARKLPESVIRYYTRAGITELYLPQEDAIKKGLLEGENILVAAPTASGKTLIAEMAIIRSVLKGGKAVYIVPLRALASEKYESFSAFRELGINVGISTGDFDVKEEWLGTNDIIVVTSEKMDSLMRNEVSWVNEISVIVVDEIHLIDSASRGPTLEITLAKLMRETDAQIIALSATIKNAQELADWLDAELVQSDWRPVELREGIFLKTTESNRGMIYFRDEEMEIDSMGDGTISLVADTIRSGGQCLIFDSTRRYAEKTAENVGKLTQNLIDEEKEDLKVMSMKIGDETETCERLARCVLSGSAFHHAGLRAEHRKIVEEGFRKNIIKAISSTPTLSFGLNLPARRVIIRNYRRYDVNQGYVPIPIFEYKQMCGRAGRPKLDPYGESVLIAKNVHEKEWLWQNYVMGDIEELYSKLGTENALRTHLLSLIAFAPVTREQLMTFLGKTFYAFQREVEKLDKVMERVLSFLKSERMIAEDLEYLMPTELGRLVSRLYIDPLSAAIIVRGVRTVSEEIGLLHLVCECPDMRSLYLRSKDYSWVEDFILENEDAFIEIPSDEEKYEWFLSEVKTAMLIHDWISEKEEREITDKFNVGPGDIRSITETGEWLMYSLAELSSLLHIKNKSRRLRERIRYGAREELLPLLTIKGVGRVRARKIYDSGYTNIKKLRGADIDVLKGMVGGKIAARIMEQIDLN
jgi:helicase